MCGEDRGRICPQHRSAPRLFCNDCRRFEDWLESEEEKWMEDADERFSDWYYDEHYPDWESSLYEEWLEEEAS